MFCVRNGACKNKSKKHNIFTYKKQVGSKIGRRWQESNKPGAIKAVVLTMGRGEGRYFVTKLKLRGSRIIRNHLSKFNSELFNS